MSMSTDRIIYAINTFGESTPDRWENLSTAELEELRYIIAIIGEEAK